MSKDIGPILAEWSTEDATLSARKVVGDDGTELLQLRVDLGVMQMFFDGRPDGEKPFGQPSLLNHLLRIMRAQSQVKIDGDMWVELDREVMQFYHRRRALLVLGARAHSEGSIEEATGYFRRAVRDANHNLQIMDFIKAYSSDEEYVLAHERFRPFVLMHRALAEAQVELLRRDPDEAVERLKAARESIEEYYRQEEQADMARQDPSVLNLRALERQVRKQHGIERTLQEQLAWAVEHEDFEEAAALRDLLRRKQTGKN